MEAALIAERRWDRKAGRALGKPKKAIGGRERAGRQPKPDLRAKRGSWRGGGRIVISDRRAEAASPKVVGEADPSYALRTKFGGGKSLAHEENATLEFV